MCWCSHRKLPISRVTSPCWSGGYPEVKHRAWRGHNVGVRKKHVNISARASDFWQDVTRCFESWIESTGECPATNTVNMVNIFPYELRMSILHSLLWRFPGGTTKSIHWWIPEDALRMSPVHSHICHVLWGQTLSKRYVCCCFVSPSN